MTEQIKLLWIAARTFGPQEQREFESAAEETRTLAVPAADTALDEENESNRFAIVFLATFVAALLWLILPLPSWIGPLFIGKDFIDKLSGYLLQAAAFVLLFYGLVFLRKVQLLVRAVPTLRKVALTTFYIAPFVALVPEIAVRSGWMTKPSWHPLSGLYDGLFASAVVFLSLIMTIAFVTARSLSRGQRRIWDDPRRAFLYELLHSLDKVLSPRPADDQPVRRVVGWMLKTYSRRFFHDPELLPRFQKLFETDVINDPQIAKKLAEERWWSLKKLLNQQKSKNPLYSALTDFLWKFHPNAIPPTDNWGDVPLMSQLAGDMRNIARCLEVFGQRQETGDPAQDAWQRRVCQERAAFIRTLQRAALLPRLDTRDYLIAEFKRTFVLALYHDWGTMPLIELPEVPRLAWWQEALRIIKTLFVAVLPLTAVLIMSDRLKDLPATLSSTVWIAAIVWLAVNLLTLVDEKFSEKFSITKELLNTVKGGKSKE